MNIFSKVSQSIVAFAPLYVSSEEDSDGPPYFPPIIGTGFAVGEGLFVTNAHVVEEWEKVWVPRDHPKNEYGVTAMYFIRTEKGCAVVDLKVLKAIRPKKYVSYDKDYYGPEDLDLSLVQVAVRGIPPLSLDLQNETIIEIGTEVGTIGFPLGEELHTAFKDRAVMMPIAQKGIVSAVSPIPCQFPNGFIINIMSQGGASGSPVFCLTDGSVIGIIDSREFEPVEGLIVDEEKQQNVRLLLPTSTNFSFAIPAHFIQKFLDASLPSPPLPDYALDIRNMKFKPMTLDLRKDSPFKWGATVKDNE